MWVNLPQEKIQGVTQDFRV